MLFPALVIFQILLPLGILYSLIKRKKISDWDVRIRQERFKILPIFMFSTLIALVAIYLLGNLLFFHLYLILWLTALIGVIITYIWKVSLHTMLNVVATILINFLFNWQLSILYIFIPIIGLARYYHKHHTIMQIIIGAILSGMITFGMLKFFGYLVR